MAPKVGRKYAELRVRMSPASRARAAQLADAMLREMPLQEIRRASHLTQEQLAETRSLLVTEARIQAEIEAELRRALRKGTFKKVFR